MPDHPGGPDDGDDMKPFLLTAFLLTGGAAFAGADGNANYGCGWTVADNGNWLTIKDHCAGIPAITGGYSTDTTVTEIDLGCETETVTERTTTEDRGGRVERTEVSVSFE
jgi:hypothetical protein